MTITNLIESLPASVKMNIIDFQDVRLKDGRDALRVVLDRVLTPEQKAEMKSPCILGLDCIAQHRYAPEIQRSYFYVVTG